MADWFLIKSNGLEFLSHSNKAKALEAQQVGCEVIRQATIVETEALDNGDAQWIKENN